MDINNIFYNSSYIYSGKKIKIIYFFYTCVCCDYKLIKFIIANKVSQL